MGNHINTTTYETNNNKLMQMKQSQLVNECKKLNIPHHGSKKDIVERIINKQEIKSKDDEILHLREQLKEITDKYDKLKMENNFLRKQNIFLVENQLRKPPKIEFKLKTKQKPITNSETKTSKTVIKYNPFQGISTEENQNIDVETEATPEWIEWLDLDALHNIVGAWVMGERGKSYEFMKVDLKMKHNGKDKRWKAQIQKGVKNTYGDTLITNIYGYGEWKLIYPTSIYVRQNIYHMCNYYIRYYNCFLMIPRDLMNLISDFTLGIGVRSLDLIRLKLILSRDSFRTTQQMNGETYTFYGRNTGENFTEQFGFSVGSSMVDLLLFCINEVENKEENNLDNYDNIMKLEQFTDDEEDQYFNEYFHNNIDS